MINKADLILRLVKSRRFVPAGVDPAEYALQQDFVTEEERLAYIGSLFSRSGGINVGFIQSDLARVGGIETWIRTLINRMTAVNVVGVVATESRPMYVDGIKCKSGQGIASASNLCDACDVVVASNEPKLQRILKPDRRHKVIYVHHGDENCMFSNKYVDSQIEYIDALACVNPVVAAEADHRGAFRRVQYIANAPDIERTRPKVPREKIRFEVGIPQDELVILYSGRFSEEKGFDRVKAIAKLLPHGVTMVAMGGDLTHSDIPRLKFVGQQSHPGNWYHAADVAISPSINEGSGLGMLEIVLSGLPLVATCKGVIAEHPRLARVVRDDASAVEWLNAIFADLRDPDEQARRCDQAIEIVNQHYSIDDFVRSWEELIIESSALPIVR